MLLPTLTKDSVETPGAALTAKYQVRLNGETYDSLYFNEYLHKKDKYAVYFGGNYDKVDIEIGAAAGQTAQTASSKGSLLILKDSTGTFVTVLRVVITATMIIYALILLYVFPILARFYNSVKDTFKNAFIMAVVNLPRTFIMLVICAAAVLATFLNTYTLWYGILIWMMAGFALVAFANSFFFKKIFAKYTPADPTADEDPDDWNLDEIEKTELDVKEDAAASSENETKTE